MIALANHQFKQILVDINRKDKIHVVTQFFGNIPAPNKRIELLGIGKGFAVDKNAEPAHKNSWCVR